MEPSVIKGENRYKGQSKSHCHINTNLSNNDMSNFKFFGGNWV